MKYFLFFSLIVLINLCDLLHDEYPCKETISVGKVCCKIMATAILIGWAIILLILE